MEATQNNPYQAPEADLETLPKSEPNASGVFSMRGRIGRLRYLAYILVQYLIAMFFGIVVAVVGPLIASTLGEHFAKQVLPALLLLCYLPLLFFTFVYAIRRLNDFGWSGWTVALMIVPFVNIILGLIVLLKKGDQGDNQYGAPPRPNSTKIKVAALGGLVLPATIGILAAIAIPAYQDYIAKIKAAQTSIQQ